MQRAWARPFDTCRCLQRIAVRLTRVEVERVAERVDRAEDLDVLEVGPVIRQEAVAQPRRTGASEREQIDHHTPVQTRTGACVRDAELVAIEKRVLVASLVGRRPGRQGPYAGVVCAYVLVVRRRRVAPSLT
jgi:bacterioferritin-associated ferredoxin